VPNLQLAITMYTLAASLFVLVGFWFACTLPGEPLPTGDGKKPEEEEAPAELARA
jgi:hypothetical protein